MQLVLVMAVTEQDPFQLATAPISLSVKIKSTCNRRLSKPLTLLLGFVREQLSSSLVTIAIFLSFGDLTLPLPAPAEEAHGNETSCEGGRVDQNTQVC